MDNKIEVEVSVGELLDKITILEIKNERIRQENKLMNIRKELQSLLRVKESLEIDEEVQRIYQELKSTNERLWDIEDNIRECEKRKDFGPEFIKLARFVYLQNDQRSKLKRELNERLGSDLIEEKSYSDYTH